eukprot:TRINITY_DN24058_c0_g1_i1.p1 TRINITY_DN24058_c0_g1~~TRINITY_DN24058_c0_g1_i1.p1  ORF type:complete len:246 (+),score=63.90 TRINITY_DN24058_c0_g1_i1:54-740(+)
MSDSDSDDAADHLQYKVLVVGDGAVGKTSLIMRFCEGGFKDTYRQTVGLDFFNKRVALPGQVNTTLQIWDIGGQQLGGKMLANYLFGSHAIILTYDVTSMESFKNLEQWLEFIKNTFKEKKTVPYLALMGNKMDLNHLRAVKAEKHSLFAVENGMVPFFVSAKTGDKVNAAFTKIAADLSGVQLTKSELDVTDAVVHAPIVNHPKASTSDAPGSNPEDGKPKKDCLIM